MNYSHEDSIKRLINRVIEALDIHEFSKEERERIIDGILEEVHFEPAVHSNLEAFKKYEESRDNLINLLGKL